MIGFEIKEPCARCSALSEDCHPWIIAASCVLAKPRTDTKGVPLAWPSTTATTNSAAGCYCENEPTFAGEFFAPTAPSSQLRCYEDATKVLVDLNGRASRGMLRERMYDGDTKVISKKPLDDDGQGKVKEGGQTSGQLRECQPRDEPMAWNRLAQEQQNRARTMESRERAVRKRELELQEEHAAAWIQVGEAEDEAQQLRIIAKAHADAAALEKKRCEEANARARRADEDTLARIAEVRSMRSAEEQLRAELALKAAAIQNQKENAKIHRAKSRQEEEQLAEVAAKLAAKEIEIRRTQEDLEASHAELYSARHSLCALEEELATLRAAVRQGESRSGASSSSCWAKPALHRRLRGYEAVTPSATGFSAGVPPPPHDQFVQWHGPSSWLRSFMQHRVLCCGRHRCPAAAATRNRYHATWW